MKRPQKRPPASKTAPGAIRGKAVPVAPPKGRKILSGQDSEPATPGTRYSTDGHRYETDRFRDEMQFYREAIRFFPERDTRIGNRSLLQAAYRALWLVAAERTSPETGQATFNPWDLVRAFEEALVRYETKTSRTLGEAFRIPDHRGRTACYGPRVALYDGRETSREDAMYRECLSRLRAGETRSVVFAKVCARYQIKWQRVAQVFDKTRKQYRAALGRDPLDDTLTS